MKNYSLIIGINLKNETILQHQIIDNTKTKIRNFIEKVVLKHGKENILIVFETTGVYGCFLSRELHKLNMNYCNLSALEIHKSTGIERGKSDK